MQLPAHKFNLKQKVFINNIDGLDPTSIHSIQFTIKGDEVVVMYSTDSDRWEWYNETQIVSTKVEARKKLETNINQLQLMIG